MDCPKCGESMKKGRAVFEKRAGIFQLRYTWWGFDTPYLGWYTERTLKKYSEFPKTLLAKPNLEIYGDDCEVGINSYEAYRCKNCGGVFIIPSENNNKGKDF